MRAFLHWIASSKFNAPPPPASTPTAPTPTTTASTATPATIIRPPTNTPIATIISATNIPTATSPLSGGTGYQQIQAEGYSSQSDTVTDSGVVTFNSSQSWTAYSGIDFGATGPSAAVIYMRTNVAGVNVQFRTGSPNGSIVCTLYPDGNGVWHSKSNTCWPKPTGIQTVYITVTGGPVYIDTIQFA